MMTRTQRTGLAAVLATATCFGWSAEALGGQPGSTVPVTIVAIQTEDSYDQAEALTKALRATIKDVPGWSLGEGDFSLEVLMLALKCGDVPDAACQLRIADQIKTDRYVWGSIHKKGNDVVGELHLWVRNEPGHTAPLEYSANLTEPNDDALRRVALDAMTTLTGGPAKGSIHVRSSERVGEVLIDGKPAGALQRGEATFDAPAGPHKVLVKTPGHLDAESAVDVAPRGRAEVALSPIHVEPPPPPPQTNWRQVGGFVGLGAGVVFGAVGLVSALKIKSIEQSADYQTYQGLFAANVTDICSKEQQDIARQNPNNKDKLAAIDKGASLCHKGATYGALSWVFFPLAGFSAAVGGYLILTSMNGSGGRDGAQGAPAGWAVRPTVGMGSGRIDVTYRW